ncbi:MAG TPA: SRPBCC family protein [Thermoanaerobaculia bacterium]|nr:SRPBCC family protein [Thermoanaerobaculia bacterium]
MTYLLSTSTVLPRPRAEVFAFFADAGNLETLTPPLLRFQILTPLPIAMHPGALIDYRLRLHGVPITWRTEITEWQPPFRFVDQQLHGPYRLWHHEHTFEEVAGGTLATDRVHYAFLPVPGVHRLFVEPDLRRIFAYRQERMREVFGGASPAEIRIRALSSAEEAAAPRRPARLARAGA